MTTTVERTPQGIIYKAAEYRGLPGLDLLTCLYESRWCSAQEDTVLHVDADYPHRAINKNQSRHLLRRTAYTFRKDYGIGQHGTNQDVVMCISSGHWLLPNLFHATVAAGGIFSCVSPAATAKELAAQMKQVDAKMLLCNADTKSIAMEAAKLAGLPQSKVLAIGSGDTFELSEAGSGKPIPISTSELAWERITDPETLENTTICIIFSSGTTGAPKAMKLSHTNIVTEASLVNEPSKEYNARFRPDFKFRTLAHLPVAHIAGIQGYFVNPMYLGGTVYWMPRFDFAKFLEYNKKYAITFFFSVPPIYLLIAKSPQVTDQFDNLELAVSGAAPLGKELQLAAQKRLGKGNVQLSQTWGLSETTGSITVLPRHLTDETGSVSSLISNATARIVDEEGKDVQPGQPGELWVKGPVVTKGYFRNDKANKESFVDGWFCTGDIGYFKDGKLYIIDRKKELIKYKALQVAPAELEALLLSHPKIQDAAVIGVHGEGTELPRAYVVADQKQISASTISKWVADQVANHKKLRGGVMFISAIPKSPAGKILRKTLREMAAKEAVPSKI
ncbi:acetyl-CoA synthetase-like protein [Thozetella sp. PMI_491]|nr:acetyl-CoA synthetase-like protein [Thozetella sp. PMI_491]